MMRCAAILILAAACAAGCSPSPSPESAPNATPAAAPPSATPGSSGAASPSGSTAAAAEAKPAHATTAPTADTKPQFRSVTIPAGTTLHVKLADSVASDTSKVEDAVRGELSQAIVIDEQTVVPAGANVRGSVVQAVRSGRVKGRASLSIGFDRLTVGDETHDIRTSRISQVARATKAKDAQKVGIGAAAGAVVGAIAGGKKGAAVGTAVGAGGGAGVVAATRGNEVVMAAGSTVATKLREPLTVQVPVR
jgi:hypothetical protein